MLIKKIQTSEIKADMVTGKDVLTSDGKVLLANGTVLKEKHIGILEKRDISELFIVTEEEEEGTEAPIDDIKEEEAPKSADNTKVIEKLEQIFANVKDNEEMNRLFTLAVQKADRIRIDN
ncbi:MAG: hypothetical protein ACYTFY_16615 [Planctomycetota bacterium]|jgi:hypothetical protein